MDHPSVGPTSSKAEPPVRLRWPRTLRARLALSHALVLLLALLLALILSAAVLVREGRRAQIEQMEELAVPLMVEVAVVGHRPWIVRPVRDRIYAELLGQQAAVLGVRLLLLDRDGQVEVDTGGAGAEPLIAGTRIDAFVPSIARLEAEASESRTIAREAVPPHANGAGPFPHQAVVLAADPLPPTTALALVAPAERPEVVGRLTVGFGVILVASLGVAAVTAVALSQRIAAPVTGLAEAADAMGAGRLEQRVAGEGPDEVGRLVARFNAMSRRIAAVDRSQRRLLASVAHELRTPLTSVQGYARALRDGVARTPAEQERALRTIEAEGARMGRLVAGLLDLARLESGQVVLEPVPVDLGTAIERVRARFEPLAAEQGVELRVASASGPEAMADDDRLAQVLGNLVDNALRHTPRGGVVELAGRRQGRGIVAVSVRDTGIGIGGDRLEQLTGHPRVGLPEGQGDGLGLGLAIVREIVAALGGTIAIESREGQGTTVTVTLPAAP